MSSVFPNMKKEIFVACILLGDDSAVSLDVHNHFENHGGDEIDVSRGKVGKEEVHGSCEGGSQTARMMSRFPSTVTRYVERMGCTHTWFCILM
jgi:hypothetical protein